MNDAISIESFNFESSADVSQCIGLLNRVFGPGTMDLNLWNWKYRENPFGDPAGWCAKRNNEVVAVRLLWPWILLSKKHEKLLAYQAVDVATDESCRRSGLFSRLNLHAMEWVTGRGSLIFNFPNFSRHSYAGYQKLGFQTLGSERWILVSISPGFLKYLGKDVNLSKSTALVDSLAGSKGSVSWTKEALEWRFARHPRIKYERFTSSDGDAVLYSIIEKKSLKIARVVYSEGRFSNGFMAKFSAHLIRSGVFLILYNGLNTDLGRLFSSRWAKIYLKDGVHYCAYPNVDELDVHDFSFELGVLDYA